MRILKYEADKSFSGKKVSALLNNKGYSSEIIKTLKRGGLLINGSSAPTVALLEENDKIEVIFPDEKAGALPMLCSDVKLLYADDDIAVADKPPYLPMHQSISHYKDTLANHFAAIYPNCKFRAITRLDKNTSGLCVIALNKLSAAIFCKNRPQKLYYAVVEGITNKDGTINAPIARENESLIKRIVSPDGQPAVTHYKTLETNDKNSLTLLEIVLETGRTHQIRVHMSHIGHPLCGDDLYGGRTEKIARQALHCGYITFVHPISGERMEFNSPIPKDMASLLL